MEKYISRGEEEGKPQEPEACFGEKRNVCRVLGEELK